MYLGIDPGQSGGIAVLEHDGSVVGAWPMPDTERDIFEMVYEFRESKGVIEFVRSRPGQGVSSSFKFGCGYGGLRMALIASGIPFVEVTPTKWQREFGLTSTKHDTPTAKKNANKARAQELFPGVKVKHSIADALLLAEWVRRSSRR